jgi:hypothetical protein
MIIQVVPQKGTVVQLAGTVTSVSYPLRKTMFYESQGYDLAHCNCPGQMYV